MVRMCACVLLTMTLAGCGGGGGSDGGAQPSTNTLPPNNLRYNVLGQSTVTSNGLAFDVTLAGIAALSLPPGAIDPGETVLVAQLDSEALQGVFEDGKSGDSDEITAAYQVQISAGRKRPAYPLSITLTVPSEIANTTNQDRYVRVYGYAQTGSDDERSSSTILRLPITAGATPNTVILDVPVELFVLNERTNAVNAHLFIASSREDVPVSALAVRAHPLAVGPSDSCAADLLAPPAPRPLVAGSPFSPKRELVVKGVPQSRAHLGQDLKVVEGTPVYAASDGVVTKVTTQHCTLTGIFAELLGKEGGQPQCFESGLPRCFSDTSCKDVLVGFGQYIEVRHKVSGKESGFSLYAHLKLGSATVQKNSVVKAGTLLALSGNTGGSTGPHLHFEGRDTARVAQDPHPCLAPTIRLVKNLIVVPKASPDAGPTPHECCSFFKLELPVEANIAPLASFDASLQLGTAAWQTGFVFTPSDANPNAYINWYGTTYRESNPETNSSRMIWGMSVHHGGQFDASLKKSKVRTTFQLQADAADPFTSQTKRVQSNQVVLDVDL